MNPPVWFCGAKITPSFETPKFSGKICDFFRFWASQMLFELSLQIDIKTYRHEIPHPRPPGRRRSDGRVLHETPCPAAVHRRKHRLADQRERLLLRFRISLRFDRQRPGLPRPRSDRTNEHRPFSTWRISKGRPKRRLRPRSVRLPAT